MPVPIVEMKGQASGGLVYMQVQEASRWYSQGVVQQQQLQRHLQQQQQSSRCTLPLTASAAGAAGAAAMGPPATRVGMQQRRLYESLASGGPTLNKEPVLSDTAIRKETAPSPITSVMAPPPCMLLPISTAPILPVAASAPASFRAASGGPAGAAIAAPRPPSAAQLPR